MINRAPIFGLREWRFPYSFWFFIKIRLGDGSPQKRKGNVHALLFSLMNMVKYYFLTLCENWAKTGTVVAFNFGGIIY